MFDIQNTTCGHNSEDDMLSGLRRFVDDHTDGFYDAAALLAGGRGVQIVDRIVNGLAKPDGPTRLTGEALHDLRDVLALEHVDDLSRPEAHYFFAIDPDEPVVSEICLLTDQFSAVLADAGLDHMLTALIGSAA